MFKNPYILPIAALLVLGILFVFQKREAAISNSEAKINITLTKGQYLLSSFKDPLEKSSVSNWKPFSNGYKSQPITLPSDGFVEFDIFEPISNPSLTNPLFAICPKSAINATDKCLFTLTTSPNIDTLTFNSSTSKKATPILSHFPIRIRVEWSNTKLMLFVDGREKLTIDYKYTIQNSEVIAYLSNAKISDFKFFKTVK